MKQLWEPVGSTFDIKTMRHLFLFVLLLAGLAIQAQDDCLLEAEIATTTALWGSEISWILSTLDGTTVAGGQLRQ